MKKQSIMAVCLLSTTTVPAVAADDTTPAAIVADDVTVPAIAADQERRWEQPYGPSYDCETAQGVADLTVCSDPVLSRMDLEVTTLHRERLKKPYRLKESYARDPIDPDRRVPIEHGSGELVPSVPELALVGAAGADVDDAIIPTIRVPSRDEVEDEQRRWLRARDDDCDFHSGIGAGYEAVPCLIVYYAKRIVELDSGMRERTGRRVLDVLADAGIVALDDMELHLANVRIDLPRVVPVTSAGTSSPTMPHPACIDALLQANVPSSIRRDACRAGTDHLPLALDTWFDTRYEEGQEYITYVPWHPSRWGQRGDRSGYRVVGPLDNGRTLIHTIAEYTGAGRTTVGSSLAVVRGLRAGETVKVEHQVFDEGLGGSCGRGIDEVDIADPDTLRLVSTIPANTLVTLFDRFPEQLHGVTESERRRLRALKDSGELDVAMSIMRSICIGRAHYDHDLRSGRRALTDVSVEVTERDRATVARSPALACLFDFLLERHPEMPAMYRPTQLHELLADFIDTCEIPGA